MRVKYTHKMLAKESDKGRLKFSVYEESEISKGVLKILRTNSFFTKPSGVFGDKTLGRPMEYERIILVDDDEEDTERIFEYFNKGIFFMLRDNTEEERQVFEAFTFFMIKEPK